METSKIKQITTSIMIVMIIAVFAAMMYFVTKELKSQCIDGQHYDKKLKKCRDTCAKSQTYYYDDIQKCLDCPPGSSKQIIGSNLPTCVKDCVSGETSCGKQCHQNNDGFFCDKTDENNPILCKNSCWNNGKQICCSKGQNCKNQKCTPCTQDYLDDFNNCCKNPRTAYDTTSGKKLCCDKYRCKENETMWSRIPNTKGMTTQCKQAINPGTSKDYHSTWKGCMNNACMNTQDNPSCCQPGFTYLDGKCYENAPISLELGPVNHEGRNQHRCGPSWTEQFRNVGGHPPTCCNTGGWYDMASYKDAKKDKSKVITGKITVPHCRCNNPNPDKGLNWVNVSSSTSGLDRIPNTGGCWNADLGVEPHAGDNQKYCKVGENDIGCSFPLPGETASLIDVYNESGNAVFLKQQVSDRRSAEILCKGAGYTGLMSKNEYVKDDVFKDCLSKKQTNWIGDAWWSDSTDYPEYYCGDKNVQISTSPLKYCQKGWYNIGGLDKLLGYPVCKKNKTITNGCSP